MNTCCYVYVYTKLLFYWESSAQKLCLAEFRSILFIPISGCSSKAVCPNVFNVVYFMFNTLTSVQVTPDRKEGQVESDVSHSGVRLKDGDHS